MWNRPGKPEGAPWIVPYLTVPAVRAALEFYESAFGFERRLALEGPGGDFDHAELSWQGQGRIMVGPETDDHTARAPMTSGVPAPIALYIYVDDLAALFERALAAGAAVIEDPAVRFWGDRVAILADPWGYKWTFAQNVADFDPEVFAVGGGPG